MQASSVGAAKLLKTPFSSEAQESLWLPASVPQGQPLSSAQRVSSMVLCQDHEFAEEVGLLRVLAKKTHPLYRKLVLVTGNEGH